MVRVLLILDKIRHIIKIEYKRKVIIAFRCVLRVRDYVIASQKVYRL